MESYISSLRTALSLFPVLAIVLTVPYIFYSYRKFGAVSRVRTLILFSFIFYMLCAYCLTVFPLPDLAVVEKMAWNPVQLFPLRFIYDFLAKTTLRLHDVHTYLPALTDGLVLQPLFNILLTVPFGIYMAYYFRLDKKKTVLMTLMLSLFFEVTQLTGLYGLYPRPYRLFDIDDLMLNTLGGFLGYLIGCKVSRFLPSRQAIDAENYKRGAEVGALRGLAAAGIDAGLLIVVTTMLSFLSPLRYDYVFLGVYAVYFIGVQALLGGRTAGKMFVNIRTVREGSDDPPGIGQLALRYIVPLGLGVLFLPGLVIYVCLDTVRSRRLHRPVWHERISGTASESTLPWEMAGAAA